jgi:hypothetical protein
MEPRDRPLVCFASKIRLHEYNVGCCSNDDLCNKNMTLEFVPKAGDDDDALLEGACLSPPLVVRVTGILKKIRTVVKILFGWIFNIVFQALCH